MNDYTLTPQEIFQVTRYKRASCQARALQALGIPCIRRIDNSLLVLRAHLENPPQGTATTPAVIRPKLKAIK